MSFEIVSERPAQYKQLFSKVLSEKQFNESGFWGRVHSKTGRVADGITIHRCDRCPYTCSTVQGMNWHRFDVHQDRPFIRSSVQGTVCVCGLKPGVPHQGDDC